ncbi:MAG TPA: hypothetical protein VIE66_01505 [Methylocella sp.]|jgi:hypothetical protein
MDFTLLGTAVRFDNLPAGPEPVIATVPALEFVRLLEMGIVPTGLAVGAHYEWLQQSQKGPNLATGGMSGYNTPLTELTNFWEKIRGAAHAELRSAGAKQGNGVLANVHFGELLCPETSVKQPVQYLGRHIVIGAVIDTSSRASVPRGVRIVPPAEGSLALTSRVPSAAAGKRRRTACSCISAQIAAHGGATVTAPICGADMLAAGSVQVIGRKGRIPDL